MTLFEAIFGPLDEGKKFWIAAAIKKPGALHKQLGVPRDEKIPAKKIDKKLKAEKKKPGVSKLEKRLQLAKTLKKLGK